MADNKRVVFLDYMRALACLMVIIVHSCEPFYLGGAGTLILNRTDGLWCTVVDSFVRSCVPLFVMISGYLLIPLKYDTGTFFRKRLIRIFIPFLIWSLMYAIVPQWGETGHDAWTSLKSLSLNLLPSGGHLWFVYMLLGLYLVMPIISPWLEKASKKEEQMFLVIWLFTLLIPMFRQLSLHYTIAARPELWGEANWNEFGTLYYVSGFMGYMLLAHYIRKYVPELSWGKTLAMFVPAFVVGWALTAGWYWHAMPKTFPAESDIELAVYMEQSWRFCTLGVMLMTVSVFMIVRKIKATGWFYDKVVFPISKLSYGMYLMHIFFLGFFVAIYRPLMPTGCCIFATAISTYVTVAVVAKLLSLIPKVGKYIVG